MNSNRLNSTANIIYKSNIFNCKKNCNTAAGQVNCLYSIMTNYKLPAGLMVYVVNYQLRYNFL